jgi:hypothetical protein
VEVAEKPAARVREARASSFDRLWSVERTNAERLALKLKCPMRILLN